MEDASGHDLPQSPKKRPRPVISCLECRRKKLKCSRTFPCQQCIKGRRAVDCSYQAGQKPDPQDQEPTEKRQRTATAESDRREARSASTCDDSVADEFVRTKPRSSPPTNGVGVLEHLQQRVDYLEQLFGTGRFTAIIPDQAISNLRSTGRPPAPRDHGLDRKYMPRDIFPHAAAFVRDFTANSSNDSAANGLGRELRNLHVAVKANRQHVKAAKVGFDSTSSMPSLPSLDSCHVLTELYFGNLEHCFRILHRPTFDKQLKLFFDGDVQPHSSFIPQLLGVISLASILGIRQECLDVAAENGGDLVNNSFKFMQQYLDNLSSKESYQLPSLQVKMLLILLRWMRLDPLEDLWNLNGQILRQALLMGLDKDPSETSESMSVLEAEMRRRLWMEVVELDMMLSLLCKMPCMVPNFTCRSPLNVNDDELRDDVTDLPLPRPFTEWTDSLCLSILAHSVKQRLKACQDVQGATEAQYEHVLEHTRRFEKILQHLPAPLRFSHQDEQASKVPSRLMARMELDISIRRPLMYLYSPFAYASDENDSYQEAREGFLQSCLMLATYQDLFDPKFSEINIERPEGYWDFFYNVYRHELNQAALGICLEIKRLSNPAPTISTPRVSTPGTRVATPFRMPQNNQASMINAVKESIEPMIRRVSHHGANLKDLAWLTIVFASVQTRDNHNVAIIGALKDLIAACTRQLEDDGVDLSIATNSQSNGSAEFENPFDFDPSWLNFPSIGLDFGFVDNTSFNFDLAQ